MSSDHLSILGEPESMRIILVELNFIIHIARYMYSETENICPSFVNLEHFMLFSKIKNNCSEKI